MELVTGQEGHRSRHACQTLLLSFGDLRMVHRRASVYGRLPYFSPPVVFPRDREAARPSMPDLTRTAN
jgi:hypothetical protein